MKASDIVLKLRQEIPKYTDVFSDYFSITSMTFSTPTVTITTSKKHGLSIGNVIKILKTKVKNPVSSLTYDSTTGLITCITTEIHDLTENFPLTFLINGADQTGYNGTFSVNSVISENEFTYTPTTAPSITTATGTIYCNEDRID